jgi:uncharacterized protein YdcH (DUF465 family)
MKMSLEKHTLVKDLPEHHHTIRHLKMNDAHFAKLFDSYHELENEVHKIEQDNARVADDYLESLKKRRVHLKDELVEMIHKTEKAL